MPTCQNYLGKTFAHTGAALAIAALSAETSDIGATLSAKLFKGSPILNLIVNFLIGLALLLAVIKTAPGGIPKYLFFIAFAFWMGQGLKPLVDRLQDKKQIQRILALTTGVFLGMAAIGFYDKQNLLGLGPYLFAALFGLVLGQLGLMIFADPKDKAAARDPIRFLGVALFAIYTAYDVQVIKEGKRGCRNSNNRRAQPDYPVESLGLFLDYINLFSYIGGGDE
jgi:FtsH-binding integral membrane protein